MGKILMYQSLKSSVSATAATTREGREFVIKGSVHEAFPS